jgi:hypothetical protein
MYTTVKSMYSNIEFDLLNTKTSQINDLESIDMLEHTYANLTVNNKQYKKL